MLAAGRAFQDFEPRRTPRRAASPYGIEGMAGNVFEWCEDVDDPGFYLRGPVGFRVAL